MDARLQRRVQRYGWDLASADYEPAWAAQLEGVQAALVDRAALAAGERVLDVACGTGLVSFAAARAVGAHGRVVGVDLSGRMIEAAVREAAARGLAQASFARMDAERLELADAGFDVALCALGLMYLPSPAAAVAEMSRVVAPGGRVALVVWGERARCGWAPVFPIVEAEVESEVCPLFFRLGAPGVLASLCEAHGFERAAEERIDATLAYASVDDACRAAFVGGPVALAWSRFDASTRARVEARYAEAIERWRVGRGYRVPGEFLVVTARR